MPRRLLAATAATLLAVLGAVVLLGYVHGADARARAGEQLTPVLVVDSEIAPGTAAEALAGSVSVQQVPTRLAAPGSTGDLSSLAGLVTDAALLPGEQVIAGQFVAPAAFLPAGAVAVPAGMVQVSVTLDAQRAVGGILKAGDLVGVQLTSPTAAGDVAVSSVFLVLHQVLVTRVVDPADTSDPTAPYLVTLAVSPDDAAQVVRGTTTQAIWLSLETAAPTSAGGSTGSSTSSTSTTVTTGDDK
jgi:pilus assembly protein CpaB